MKNLKKELHFFLKLSVLNLLFILSLTLQLAAQEAAQPPSENTETTQEKTEDKTNDKTKKKEVSEFEEKRDTILYGTGDDILELIKRLKSDEDDRFDTDLQKIFAETKIPAIREALFAYFAEKKNDCLKADALMVLENKEEFPQETVRTAISYIRELEIYEGIDFLRQILKDEEDEYRDLCIAAIGKIGKAEDAVFLSELFDSEASEDEKKSLIIKQNIMFALEELHTPEIRDFLIRVAEDSDENAIIRGAAVSALGKIGDEGAIPVLSEIFEDKDPILRTAAIKGIAGFKDAKAKNIMIQAFKDSYYKVRLQAIQSAKEEKAEDAVPFILYRAKKDPENSVRLAAIEALSHFNNAEANEWLIDSFNEERTGLPLRLKIAESLLKNNFDVIFEDVKTAALKAISDKKQNKFSAELGKVISKVENKGTAPIAEAYLNHKDAILKSIGLDMFKRNKYPELVPLVSAIAEDEKNGTLSRRAKDLLQSGNTNAPQDKQTGK
ncbi:MULTISPECIES: HEAT repeat domain-containing protein [unclassified Treponema]|uniref:HEAT repeat domain-containing protein n=1 Tax=unclassified Treponema TaxID=2638727 RepID=UPI0020A2BE90|nr:MULTISPECIES: HEAT repeat domain-containing protein [unclassified Treponema]UTC66937.1 HEAT repeat domain-containing protein [Treponema sp. OMZ 789]UTC69666.1 HEAT repeat domain-containing protein [Treponema sp. OMZ 790]UTC72380.1 HEAT repeat domain-containing protein [Treponema sp. OMZ 791]